MHVQVPVLLEHLSDKYVGQYGTLPTAEDIQMWRYSVYLLYWYKGTNTDAAGAAGSACGVCASIAQRLTYADIR